MKWRDWKLHYAFTPEAGAPAVPPLMRLFNLLSDPKEETDIKDANPWVASVIDKIVADFEASTERHPHVPMNARDPYVPDLAQLSLAASVYTVLVVDGWSLPTSAPLRVASIDQRGRRFERKHLRDLGGQGLAGSRIRRRCGPS